MYTITLIPGDGTGPEISEATKRVIEAPGIPIQWDIQDAGLDVYVELDVGKNRAGVATPAEAVGGLTVRHDDAEREYSYDRESPVARLDRALDEAAQRGWIVVSIKADWRQVYADPAR